MAAQGIRYRSAEEFYADKSLPERCELIEGVVYMSPSPNNMHQRLLRVISYAIESYITENNCGCELFLAPADVKLSEGVIVQPDIYVTCHPEKLDGQKHNGAPDWVIEIVSPASGKQDHIVKKKLYRETGVREYWIADPQLFLVHRYLWDGDKNESETFSFDDDIPVHIFGEMPHKLSIKISGCLPAVQRGEQNGG